tara:strand:+ start:677 stop:2590 length:1914 start_codon:yes stop_codon:yes gene_type:complete
MKFLAVDTETTGVDLFHSALPFAVSACDEGGKTWFWEWKVNPKTRKPRVVKKDLEQIKDLLSGKTLVFHNAKFDLRALANLGISIGWDVWATLNNQPAIKIAGIEDTLLASHVCDSNESHGLKYLAEEYLDILDTDQEELLEEVRSARRYAKSQGWELGQAKSNTSNVHCDYWMPRAAFDSEVLETYAVQDAVRTMLLWKMYEEVMQQKELATQYILRKQLIPISYDMETTGVSIKPHTLTSEIKRYLQAADVAEEKCYSIASDKDLIDENFNIRSSIQLQKVLYGDRDAETANKKKGLSCKVIEETKTGFSTSAGTLRSLYNEHTKERTKAHRFLGNLLECRKATTCANYLTSYKNLALKQGSRTVLHPSFNQTGTRTTRWSSSNPNGQNIGSGGKDGLGQDTDDYCLRSVFGPSRGRIWYCADYSQLELRILAVLAQEEKMLETFANDGDIHQLTADLCNITRKQAKGVNFALVYGAGREKLDRMTGTKNFSKTFGEAFPGVAKYMKAMIKQVKKKGYVPTLGGYRLVVPRDKAYIGTNYSIQGSAGDILNRAMLATDCYLKESFPSRTKIRDGQLILCIHDELVFDLKKGAYEVGDISTLKSLMELAGEILGVVTPVEVSKVSSKWSEKKGIEL